MSPRFYSYFMISLFTNGFLYAAKVKEKLSPEELQTRKVVQVFSEAFRRYESTRDTVSIFKSMEEQKIELSTENKKFLLRELSEPMPLVYSRGTVLVMEFRGPNIFHIEFRPESPSKIFINQTEIEISQVENLSDLKKLIVTQLRAAEGHENSAYRLLDFVLPSAHADVGELLTRYGGLLAMGTGLLLAANGHPVAGLAFGVGGLVYTYQQLNEKDESTKHSQ